MIVKEILFNYFKALPSTWFFYLSAPLFLYDNIIVTYFADYGFEVLTKSEMSILIIITFIVTNFEVYKKVYTENQNLKKKLNELESLKPDLSLSFKEWLPPGDADKKPQLMKKLTLHTDRFYIVQVVLHNEGNAPAENVHVHLDFPEGFKLELPERSPFDIMSIRKASWQHISINGQEVVLSHKELKHGYNYELKHFFITHEEISGTFDIEYSITANNLPHKQHGKLQISVQ